jgi:Na+/proline symporter
MNNTKKSNVVITLVVVALYAGSYITSIKKVLNNISIKTLCICEAVAILMFMYSAFSIMGHNASTKVITIGIISIALTIAIIFLLLNKPKSDWQKDWLFETD